MSTARVTVTCSLLLFVAMTGYTATSIDFNGWHPANFAHGGQITGTDLKGPAGETVFYLTGNWTTGGTANRPDDILTVPTVPNGTYNIDIYAQDDKDVEFTTNAKGEIATLTGNGAGTTFRKQGPMLLQIQTVEIIWNSDAQAQKRLALENNPKCWTKAGKMTVPIGSWDLHWWGMRDYGNAPSENIDLPFTVFPDRVEPAELLVRGGTPDPAIFHINIAAGEAAASMREAVISAQPVSFENVTSPTGLTGVDSAQAAWIDYDGDGWTDLQTQTVLWHNETGKKFVKSGPSGLYNAWGDFNNDGRLEYFNPGSTVACFATDDGTFLQQHLPQRPMEVSDGGTVLDIDGDGLLDLYTGGYENNWVYQPDCIYKNLGNQKFEMFWKSEGRAQPARGITACDFDNDGDTDIYVTHYRLEANVLWLNDGKGGLTNGAGSHGAAGGNGHGIGSAWGDIDNDGLIDLFAGNFAHGGQPQSQFLKNLGPAQGHHFENKGTCGLHYQESYGSPALGDCDNDGDLDLFFTTVYGGDQAVLYRNDGNWQFSNITTEAGLQNIRNTFQAAWGDFDNDGDLDLMAGGRLWRNNCTEGNWLKVKLQGSNTQPTASGQTVNYAAIGAQVRIRLPNRVLTRQVEGGTGRGNMNEMTLHFGLGAHDGDVELEISWPYAKEIQTASAQANTTVTVVYNGGHRQP